MCSLTDLEFSDEEEQLAGLGLEPPDDMEVSEGGHDEPMLLELPPEQEHGQSTPGTRYCSVSQFGEPGSGAGAEYSELGISCPDTTGHVWSVPVSDVTRVQSVSDVTRVQSVSDVTRVQSVSDSVVLCV